MERSRREGERRSLLKTTRDAIDSDYRYGKASRLEAKKVVIRGEISSAFKSEKE